MIERNNLEKIADKIYFSKAQPISVKKAANFYIDLDEVKQYNQEIVNLNDVLFNEEKRQYSLAKLGAIIGAGEIICTLGYGAIIDPVDITGPIFGLTVINNVIGSGLLAYGFIKSDHAGENSKRNTISKLGNDSRFIDEIYARAESLTTIGNKLESEMQAVKATYAPALRNFREVNSKYDNIVQTLEHNSKTLSEIKDSIDNYKAGGK